MKTIYINENRIDSILYAEIQKAKLENKGYTLLETRQIGLNEYILYYII